MDIQGFLLAWDNGDDCIEVQTSGSTGIPKKMRVKKSYMLASARRTNDYFGLKKGDRTLLCMSLDYIAGKMMAVRAIERGLQMDVVEPCGHPLANVSCGYDFMAMVPMQVWNSLRNDDERVWLCETGQLLIGGGEISREMESELEHLPCQSWSSYGMTETLSHIALRRLSGPEATEWYTPLPGVSLSLTEDGCLVIDAPAVHDGRLVTNDIAEMAPDGRFKILGRKDNVICSGGIKIQAEEVERLLRAHLRVPYMITKRRDEKFGEVVVLLTEGDVDTARDVCQRVLPKYWQPRDYVHTDQVPMTETGKPARKQAEQLVQNPSR